MLNRLRSRMEHFNMARGLGHTRLMTEGLLHYEGSVILVAHTRAQAEMLANEAMATNPNIKITPRGVDEPPLRGARQPIAFDNSALLLMFMETSRDVAALNDKLDGIISSLTLVKKEG